MKRNFTKLMAAFALLVGLTIPMGMWGQTRSVTYEPATSISAGDVVLLVAEGTNYKKELSGFSTTSTIYGTVADYTTAPAGVYPLTVVAGNSSGSFAFKNSENKYLSWSSGNSLQLSETLNNRSSWTFNYTNTVTTLTNVGTTSRQIKYNSSSPRFACYESGQQSIKLYKQVSGSTTYTVTYNANGGTGTMTDSNSPYTAGATVTVLDNEFTRTNYEFNNWNTAADGSGTSYDEGDTFTINANTTLYAQWTQTGGGTGGDEWVLTPLADLTATDVFVIVGNNGSNYAMSNNNGTSSAPGAVAVTVSGNNLTGTIANTIQWTISGNATDGYTFYPNGSSSTWLYCTNTNNGVRVGTNTNKTFKVDSNSGYLKHDGTSRYVGIYQSQDWRCYTSTSTNIDNQTFAFYKKVTGGVVPPSISAENVSIEYNAVSGSIAYTINNGVDGGILSAATESDWLTLGQGTTSPIAFTCTANEANTARTATVTLTYTYGDNETVTKDVTVTQAGNPNAPGTQSNPYTVAEAIEALNQQSPINNAFVSGIVCQVDGFNSTYHSITYWISDDGTTTTKLEVYSGKGINGADFSSIDDIQLGDVVVVKGTLKIFNSTYEFDYNNELVSLTRPATIVIPAEALALPCTANDNGSFAVSYTNNFVAADAEANLYTDAACNEAFQNDWIILDDMSTPYDAIPYVLEANPTTTSRTVYMKVTAMDSELNILEKVFTITQAGQPTYTVTYVPNGGSGTMNDPDSPYIAGDIVELLTNTFTAPEGMVWDSWAVTDAENNEVTVEGGMFEMPASNVTVTAQWVADPNATQYEWVLTDLADLTSTDIFVIVGTRDNESYYGMSNDKGTSTQPSAVAVTIANNKLSSVPGDNIKWNVSGDNTDGYTFYPNGSTSTWLYCNTNNASGSNTNMRVGTGDRKLFVLDNNNYLVTKDEYTDRYVSLNGSTDWRGYTNTGQATVISFFKRQVASTDPAVYTSVSAIDLAYDQTSGSFTYDLENAASEYTMNVTVNTEAQSWLSATINTTTSTVTITAAVNDGEQRQGIVTVNYLEDGNIEANAQVTVTQAEFVIDYAELPFAYDGNGTGELPVGFTPTGLGTYNTSPKMKFDGAGDNLIIKFNEAPTSLSYTIKGNGSGDSPWAGTFKVQTSADGVTYEDLATYTSIDGTPTVTHIDIASTMRYIKWVYVEKSLGNVALGNIHASANYDIYGTVTAESLNLSSKSCTIHQGGILEVTNSLTNTDATNFIIEDGAQYIGNSVMATVQKSITACEYNNQNNAGYYLIASPISANLTATNVNGLLTTDYDLYKFNNTADLEWINYKAGAFTIDPEVGYLYASGSNTTIDFAGALNEMGSNGNYTVTVVDPGWNLIGNPLPFNVSTTTEFQVLNSDGDGFIDGSEINPCDAILVQTTETDEVVTFTRAARTAPAVTVDVTTEQGNVIDNVRVRFDEGRGMNKFYLNPNHTKLFIQQGNEDFAVVRSANQGEMPVSFKVAENGTYTINVEVENMEMDYLHLIDNMTGADVDLLQTPSYSFDARTTDYTSRFRLVFSGNGTNENGATTGSETFAYFNGSEWQISNMGEATLQVVDVMGRIVKSETISGNASVSLNEVPGVYVMRLVNGENVKTQKIVVR